MTNLFAPPRYDERIDHLLVGVEPHDAVAGRRLPGPLRLLVEDNPVPLHRWRSWRQGETLDTVLGGLDLHPSGRFARVEGRAPAGSTLVVRVVEPLRRIVPRRLTLDLTAQRTFPVGLFPGAGAAVPTGATVVRGRVTRLVDPGTGERAPCAGPGSGPPTTPRPIPPRWGGPTATTAASSSSCRLRRHRHRRAADPAGAAADGRRRPADPAPRPDRPVAAHGRPPVGPAARAPGRPRRSGIALAGQTTFGPFPFTVPIGRETSIEFRIPYGSA